MFLHEVFYSLSHKDIIKKMIPLSLVIFFIALSKTILAPVLPIFLQNITNDLFLTGILLSLTGIVGIFLSIPLGVLTDKFELKRILQIMFIGFVIMPILFTFSNSFLGLFFVIIITAIIGTLTWCAVWTYAFTIIGASHK